MRKERDSLGTVSVADNAYWGAQTQRALNNFKIGCEKMPQELIAALVLIKKACASVNAELQLLELPKAKAICRACDKILQGGLESQFPLTLWQTGSGTQTNMNVNEVIAHMAHVHPNDDVNMSQSSNDVFPSAIHIAACMEIEKRLFPALKQLQTTLKNKEKVFRHEIKIGRTHLMDAAPVTLGQEFSGYVSELSQCALCIKQSLKELHGLALGATAVGTGLNAPKGFAKLVTKNLSTLTKSRFVPAKNFFAALSTSGPIVSTSSALKRLACCLYKIANDIRWMGSGPRCGLSELLLPENEPGSSIMPGKVNPTQCEAMLMVCMQAIGADSIITFAASQGNFELNVARPVIAYNFLQTIALLADVMQSFDTNCARGLKANRANLQRHVERSLMHATALNPHIGYDAAAKIVRKAHHEHKTLKEASLELGLLSEKEFNRIVNPQEMV